MRSTAAQLTAAEVQTPASGLSGSVMAGQENASQSMMVVQPKSSFSSDDLFMMKLSQMVMMGIGFLAIWGGVFSVAFDEDATNQNFLVLFVGGLASFLVSIGLIELQSKKNDYQLYDIQNYFLGIAFFFSTVGVLWGTRYMMGVMTGTFELDWFGNPAAYTETDWSPNANGIYAQTATCLLLTYGHYRLLKRYSGDTSFGWGVATYAPMAVLIAGVGPWIRWSENVVSWELGLAIVSIIFVSLEMSLRSNKALNFVVVAFAAGLVPIMYETLNSNAPPDGAGGALSLMVFVIAIQGYYAARQDLRKEVMERASLLLIGQVVVAIALVRTAPDFNLILGPFRAGDYPGLAPYLNIPVALWCTVLLAYFPAVLQQRVPWMPVGLAAALLVLPMDSSTVPWVLSMLVIPYMVFISKVARAWVVNLTMLVFSASYVLTDWYGYSRDITAQNSFGGTWLHVLIPLFLLAVAEGGRSTKKLQTSTTLAMIGSVVLSRAILDPEWYLPWLLIAYMFFLNGNLLRQSSADNVQDRKDTTLAIAFTSLTILLLALIDNLNLPPGEMFEQITDIGFRPQFLVLSVALYVLSMKANGVELDAGSIVRWLGQGQQAAPTYDSSTGMWVVDESNPVDTNRNIVESEWTPLARMSLLGALTLFTFSISNMNAEIWADRPYLVLLIALPVAMLVREMVSMDAISSATRATGVALLVFLAAPLSFKIATEFQNGAPLFTASLMLDAILVTAPLIVNAVIAKRGLDLEGLSRDADRVTYFMLMVLAILDTSGGLLMLPILSLVAVRTVRHQLNGVTLLVPLVLLLPGETWWNNGILTMVVEMLPSGLSSYLLDSHEGPFLAIIGVFVTGHMTFNLFSMYHDEDNDTSLWAILSLLWFSLGLLSCLPDGYWIPTLATLMFIPYLWYSDKSAALPYTLGLLFMSLFIGFSLSETFQPISDSDAASWSGLLTGVAGSLMAILHTQNRLFRTAPADDDEKGSQDSTAALAAQIGALGYIAGYSIFFGIGPVFGLAIIAYSALKNGQVNSMLLLPILMSFSIVNIMVQSEIGTEDQRTTIAGMTLAVQGIILTLLSAKDDLVYDWESITWESDEVFFSFMDRLGIAGVSYSIIGIFVAFNNVDLESIAYLLMTVYLIVIGVQGFGEENDARWRRGLGGYGSIVTAFLFANSLENALFGAVGFVLMGMVALGFGFLFMQRMNEEDTIYTQTAGQTPASQHAEPPHETEPEGELPDSEEEEENEVIALDDEEEASEDDVDDEHEEGDEEMDGREVPEAEPVPSHSGLLSTGEGFALRLPKEAVNNIIATLQTTPHEGYLPVVAFGPTGQIMLTFEDPEETSN